MAGTDVAVAEQGAGELDLAAGDKRRMNALWRECELLSRSAFCPEEYKNDAATCFALARYGEPLGLTPMHSVARLYIMKGRIDVPYDVTQGAILRQGHEVFMDETSSERCTISFRRAGQDRWQTLTYTIADARRAGLLDVWVEKWQSAQSGKRYKLEHTVGTLADDGSVDLDPKLVEVAEAWAKELIDKRDFHFRDNWLHHPDDMLAAKAVRRVAKRFCPDVLLFGGLDDEPTVEQLVADAPIKSQADDEPAEGEIIDDGDPQPEVHPDDDVVEAEIVPDDESNEDATQKVAGDDGADDEALPADQPGGSTGRDGVVPASEPAAASGGGAQEDADEAPTPDPAPTAAESAAKPALSDEPLAGSTFNRSFAIHVREASMPAGHRPLDDEDRHALVAYATQGRTRSTKEVRASEVSECFMALKDLERGRLRIVDVDGVRTVAEA